MKRVTEDELAVARHILSGDDPRLELVWRKLEYAPVRRSQPNPSAIEIAPEYTNDALRFPFEVTRLDSPDPPTPEPIASDFRTYLSERLPGNGRRDR